MTSVDAGAMLGDWYRLHEAALARRSVQATFRRTHAPEIDKAMVGLVASSHIASITLWGNGMLEFIVLDVSTKTLVAEDTECDSSAEVGVHLDACLAKFAGLLPP